MTQIHGWECEILFERATERRKKDSQCNHLGVAFKDGEISGVTPHSFREMIPNLTNN